MAATLALAASAHRRGEEPLAVVLCGLGTAAVAPFSWSHHWVWVVPLAVLMWQRRRWLLLAGVLVATAAMITALPGPGVGPIPATGLVSLAPDAYLVLVLVGLGHDEGPAGGRGLRGGA